MKEDSKIILVEEGGMRLDQYLAVRLSLSRAHVQKIIEGGHVEIEQKKVKANLRLRGGESIEVRIPEPEPLDVLPEAVSLDIIHEDADIVVLNKPRGMVVHPASGNRSGTLVNALLAHCTDLSGIGGVERPGIVHRLDKDTSGLLVVAKNDLAHRNLCLQIESRSFKKEYLALVHGHVSPREALVDAPIGRDPKDRKKMAVRPGGREAQTAWKVLEYLGEYTFLSLRPVTGRTHQIRVHLAFQNYPVVGDPVYSKGKNPFNLKGQFLHAFRLAFAHPITGAALSFEAPLPDELARILEDLRGR